MAAKDSLHVGDKVEGLRAFDKSHRVKGVIWQILNGPYIDVQLENGTIEAMHVDDVKVLESAPSPAPKLNLVDPKVKEAIEYVISRGYSQEAAESIVFEHSVETILESKAEEAAATLREEEQARRKAEEDAAAAEEARKAEEAAAKHVAETEKPKADAA